MISFILRIGASRRVAQLLALGLGMVATFDGCAFLKSRDVELKGKAVLEGATLSGNAGILVDVDGLQSTQTAPDGSYTVTGMINGDDQFQITFSRTGYQNAFATGSLTWPTESSQIVKVTVPTVTLHP